MSQEAQAIGGPIAGTEVIVDDDCTHFTVICRSCAIGAPDDPVKTIEGHYNRIPGVSPARFMWQGWGK